MAELKVEVVKIDEINEHPNADRMELAMVGGYQICVQKGLYLPGMLAVYFPVDSVLNDDLEKMIFGPDSKVKLDKHRVRAIRLRGAISEGMLVPLGTGADYMVDKYSEIPVVFKEGTDLTELLGVVKYQPPVKGSPNQTGMPGKTKPWNHPDFRKYTDIQHLKKYIAVFEDGDEVIVTEKIHGTNFRAGWVPFIPRTFLQKLKNIFRPNPEWEFVYGSHNVQLQSKGSEKAFADDVYGRIVKQKDLKNKIPKGQVWYGEIFGDGIQKNYSYSFTEGQVDVAFFDVMSSDGGWYYDWDDMVIAVKSAGEQVVPWIQMQFDRRAVLDFAMWPIASNIDRVTKPVEGFVIRSRTESHAYCGRRVLKLITDAYALAKDNTDWH